MRSFWSTELQELKNASVEVALKVQVKNGMDEDFKIYLAQKGIAEKKYNSGSLDAQVKLMEMFRADKSKQGMTSIICSLALLFLSVLLLPCILFYLFLVYLNASGLFYDVACSFGALARTFSQVQCKQHSSHLGQESCKNPPAPLPPLQAKTKNCTMFLLMLQQNQVSSRTLFSVR